jgi:hypothetical protein
VTDFNMVIEPWVRLASSTRCAVYPGIIGLSSSGNQMCIPEEYEPEGLFVHGIRERSSKITRENIRALSHAFYAEGADGVSFFNFYSAHYSHLYPIPEICVPAEIEGRERCYVYLKREPMFGEWDFLQLVLPHGSSARKSLTCRLHENLREVKAHVRLKARRLTDPRMLRIDVNGRQIATELLALIPHGGEGFLYIQFPVEEGMIRDGTNEIGFALNQECTALNSDIIIQEVEIRVLPIEE